MENTDSMCHSSKFSFGISSGTNSTKACFFFFSQESLRNYEQSVCAAARDLDCKGVLGLVKRTEPMSMDADEPMSTDADQWAKMK